MSFIHHTLMMLEDSGMFISYPHIRHVTFDEDGKSTCHMSFCCGTGKRVTIEQNQPMKFMMMFTLLDFYIDSNYQKLEGKSFAQKYKNLLPKNDSDLMFRELFRIAKVIRNSLVHNPSSFKISNGEFDISYSFKGTDFCVKISADALTNFYTSLVMYIKGDLGKGNYFIGIMRSIYNNILRGIVCFSDEFGKTLDTPSKGLEIKPYVREILLNPEYTIKEDAHIQIKIAERKNSERQGMDFYIEHNGEDILVPMEALGPELTINERELLDNWKYEGPFPSVKKNL